MDLAAKIKGITLEGLTTQCFPKAEAANELARLIALARRRDVAAPFIVMPLINFLPTWAKEVPNGAEQHEAAATPVGFYTLA